MIKYHFEFRCRCGHEWTKVEEEARIKVGVCPQCGYGTLIYLVCMTTKVTGGDGVIDLDGYFSWATRDPGPNWKTQDVVKAHGD